MIQTLRVLVLEGKVTADEAVEHNSCAPDVSLGPNVFESFDQLGRSVTWRATSCYQLLIRLERVTQTKIHYLQVLLLVQKQVLRFDVPVSNAKLSQILNAGNELLEKAASLILLEMVLGSDVVEQLTVAAVLHNEEQSVFGLYDFVELNDGRMAHYSEDVDLPGYALNIVHVVDLPLVQDLYRYFLPRENMVPLLHFSKGALSECFLYLVVANQAITHVDNFFMYLALNRHADFSFIYTVLKLNQPVR